MPVFAIAKLETKENRILIEKYNLESFSIFSRSSIKNIIRVMIREVSGKTKDTPALLEIREHLNDRDEIKILTQKRGNERVVIITDGGYSSEIAYRVVVQAFKDGDYGKLIKEYKSWEDKDVMKQAEDELKKCGSVVAEGLSQVLERGESLSELVEKSENLSTQTKMLFKSAKKRNRCC